MTNYARIIWIHLFPMELFYVEAVARRCSVKKVFLKISCQSLFFNKIAGLRSATLFKKETLTQVFFLWILRNFQEHFFYRTPPVAAFVYGCLGTIVLIESISGQCLISIPPENGRKGFFWRIQGVQRWNSDFKCVELKSSSSQTRKYITTLLFYINICILVFWFSIKYQS